MVEPDSQHTIIGAHTNKHSRVVASPSDPEVPRDSLQNWTPLDFSVVTGCQRLERTGVKPRSFADRALPAFLLVWTFLSFWFTNTEPFPLQVSLFSPV